MPAIAMLSLTICNICKTYTTNMGKHVTWSSETKTHDGNPEYSVPYHKTNATTRKYYPKTVQRQAVVLPQEYDMAWLEYCTANFTERGNATVL